MIEFNQSPDPAVKERFKRMLRVSAKTRGLAFERVWDEFEKRCSQSNLKRELVVKDLIYDIQANLWPKKK